MLFNLTEWLRCLVNEITYPECQMKEFFKLRKETIAYICIVILVVVACFSCTKMVTGGKPDLLPRPTPPPSHSVSLLDVYTTPANEIFHR
jgi:hypothetical protein